MKTIIFTMGTRGEHFKREMITDEERASNMYLYRIIDYAEHTETRELLTIYQALYGDFWTYNAACEELKQLREKKAAIENEVLVDAFMKSNKTLEEAIAFFVF